MGTVLVSTILERCKTALNDAGAVRWTEAELLSWASEGQVELVSKVAPDAAIKTSTVALVAGAKQSTPSDCIEIVEIRQNASGPAVTVCDRNLLDRFSPSWMTTPTASGAVENWMPDPQPDTFYVSPAQSETPGSVVMTYSYLPAALTLGGTLGVRDIYQAKIEDYILFRAFSKEDEAGSQERAIAYRSSFYGSKSSLARIRSSKTPAAVDGRS